LFQNDPFDPHGSEALRYDVEAGSPLYAEVFRRLVQNEGLKAVLDLVPQKRFVRKITMNSWLT
jgi:hypothetical protein